MGHTPGPWSIGHVRNKGQLQSFNELPIHVGAPGVNGGQGNSIAIVHLGGRGALSNSVDDLEANGQLMAASPDLLAACRELLAAYARNADKSAAESGESSLHSSVQHARAAIAKATKPQEQPCPDSTNAGDHAS